MRITRLLLARYGHLSDVDLAFLPEAGLHIVLGANEAGKSTALAAVADALFGFPERTQFGFLHDRRDLRIGIGLQAADGRTGEFFRRKGRQDTLSGASGETLPESAIAGFLAGASRERFIDMFGMDGAQLRRGGADILEFRGEAGQSILQAYARRQNARGALASLNEAALALYGDRRGARAFHAAAEAFRAARRLLEERSVRPAAYEEAVREREACVAARAGNAAEMRGLDAERVRLDRIRRTSPARLALLRDRARKAALGEVRPLPADAQARRGQAIQAREIAARARDRETEAQAADEAALRGLAVDEAVLAQAGRIAALAADLNRVTEAARDRETQVRVARYAMEGVAAAARRLGLDCDAQAACARMPNDLVRQAAQRAIDSHTRLAARSQDTALERARAVAAVQAARQALDAAVAPAPAEALVAAIETAKAEGPIDAQLAQADAEHDAARAALSAALGGLAHWTGTAEALAAARLPHAAAIAEAEAALAASGLALAERRREVAALDAAALAIAADKAGLLAAGAPPTAQAVAAARARRDLAWRLIRRQHVDGGPAPEADEMADLPSPLADALASLIAGADALADRRAGEAGRVAAYEQCLASEARTARQRAAAASACAEAEALLAASRAAWESLWQASGIVPGDPAAMREWRLRRETVLACLNEAGRKREALKLMRARHEAVRAQLAAIVKDQPPGQVAPLLRAAERRWRDHEAARSRHAEATRALADAERALAAIATKQAALATELDSWRAGWSPVAVALGLPAQSGAQAGADALGVWTELERHAAEWRRARERVEEMTAAIDAFAAGAAACVASCAPDLAGTAPDGAVQAMAARLAASRAAAASREEKRAAMAARAARLAALAAELAGAEDTLQALRAVAGAADDAALQDAIARSQAAAALDVTIAEREAELRRLDDGLSFDELAREAEGEAPDALPGRIADIDERRRAIAAENEALARTLLEVESRIAAMERGQDAAEAAQRMQDEAAAARDIAERYVRLRMAHTLLRAGIETFRREQQAPLLAEAGRLFAALTAGRYARLATDETDDGRVIVVAERPDGTQCPADRLSEGTRDQLYLALRLAAIGLHAAHAEPLPFIADDLLASFDDTRARAALGVLRDFGRTTQTILFTHHAHIAKMADSTMQVQNLLPTTVPQSL